MNHKELNGFLFFDPNDKIYLTHFPSCPVVPGSIIVDEFVKIIKDEFPDLGDIIIKDFSFLRFLIPGEYSYKIECCVDTFSCYLFRGDTIMTKGTVCCG
ncbi:MAG: hypothetical protein WCJ49_01935 [Deltaproteobacteria bacterium]